MDVKGEAAYLADFAAGLLADTAATAHRTSTDDRCQSWRRTAVDGSVQMQPGFQAAAVSG